MANQVQLTEASTGNKFSLNSALILKVATDTLGALVQYINETDGEKRIKVVSESPTNIASVSSNLITITDAETNQAYWISIDRIGNIDQTGTYVSFDYDREGAAPQKIEVTNSITSLYTLIEEKRGNFVYAFDAVSATSDTISLEAAEGDVSAKFTSAVAFTVMGSATAEMNTIWVTSSSAYGTETVITVDGAIPAGASETGIIVLQA